MKQTNLFDFYKSTKIGGCSQVKTVKNVEITPKQRRRITTPVAVSKERTKLTRKTPVKSSTTLSTPKKPAEMPLIVSISSSKPKTLTPPMDTITLDDSDDAETPPNPPKPAQPSGKLIEKSSGSKNPSPNRSLNFTAAKSSEKREKINNIMSNQTTREDSFAGYALTSTTSRVESLGVTEIFTQQVKKDLSFANASRSALEECGMYLDDDWDSEDFNEVPQPSSFSSGAQSHSPSKPQHKSLRILPVESINQKFDMHNKSLNVNDENSPTNCDKKNSSPAKYEELKKRRSFSLRLQNSSSDKSEKSAKYSPEVTKDEEVASCPQTPKKASTSPRVFKTPERSPIARRLSLKRLRTPDNSPTRSNDFDTPHKRSPVGYLPLKASPRVRDDYSPRKIFADSSNFDLVVENLNLAKQESIPMNEFDLEQIYDTGKFEFQWGIMDTSIAERYDPADVVSPMNHHSQRLFDMIRWVFAEPMNCGYFNEEERNFVFRMMSLGKEAQVLLARMLKRDIRWFRVRKLKYEEHIGGNMEQHFEELVEKGFFDCDYNDVDIEVILNLLQVDELKQLCKEMKKAHIASKPKMIAALKQIYRQTTGLFGSKSPREVLKSSITSMTGPILILSDQAFHLIHRILVLYYPNHDPEESLSDVFRLFSDVHYGNKIFPSYTITPFPLFRNRQSLIDYVEAKLAWMNIVQVINEKNKSTWHWDEARKCGTAAYEKLKEIVGQSTTKTERDAPRLPSHIGRFSAVYVWSKILLLSIDAFKKLKLDGYRLAETYLQFLLNNREKISTNIGRIYKELTMIEMSHLKDLEKSAELTLEAFAVTSSLADQAEMMERARKLAGRAKGISQLTKARLKEILEVKEEQFVCIPREEEIEVTKVDREERGKSLWQLDLDNDEKAYGSVESVALSHYATTGYPKGIHCEGSLPVTLFACLFWREIYGVLVPGAFVSQFQREPLDLFGSHFFKSRREDITKKLAFLEHELQKIDVISDIMVVNYSKYSGHESIISKVVGDPENFGEIIRCLGKNGVLGICKKIIFEGFVNWRSGFPDLFVWNDKTGRCKVVEVKGPGDTLSVKQKLWIRYLQDIGVKVDVCHVKAKQKC